MNGRHDGRRGCEAGSDVGATMKGELVPPPTGQNQNFLYYQPP